MPIIDQEGRDASSGRKSMKVCPHCMVLKDQIVEHILEEHGFEALKGYTEQIPVNNVVNRKGARVRPVLKDAVTLAGVSVDVNTDVPVEACLVLPDHYRFPTGVPLSGDVFDVLVCLKRGRSTFISGPQGSGKDSVVMAYSWFTRTPAKMFQVMPEEDIQAWLYTHEFRGDESYYLEGELLKAVRDGYTTSTGRVIPYLILISDFDRARKDQAEAMRLILDSTSGKVKGPNGKLYDVLKGTRFVVTANTTGGGDSSGMYISANVMDTSIMDRFERGVQFHRLPWSDEEKILFDRFPQVFMRDLELINTVEKIVTSIQKETDAGTIFYELSHRGICTWVGATLDRMEEVGDSPSVALSSSFRFLKELSTLKTRATSP